MESVIYLSYTLSESTPLYGNENGIKLSQGYQQCKGDSCNTMICAFPNHSGTHVDVPRHFSENGLTITDYPPEFWIFNCVEFAELSQEVQDGQLIEPDLLPAFIQKEPDLLIIKTGYGKYRRTDRYTLSPPGISENVAHWLRKHFPSVRCVGVDLISISSFTKRVEGRLSHRAFLSPEKGNPILLIEDMKLDNRKAIKKVIVSPLQIEQADGAPCIVMGFL